MPLLLCCLPQLVQIGWLNLPGPNLALQYNPDMFNNVHVWGQGRPWENRDVLELEVRCGCMGCVHTCIVLLEDEVGVIMKERDDVHGEGKDVLV